MIESREFDEVEPIEPWGEDYEDAYYDGEDLELEYETSLHILEDLEDDAEWERF